MKEHRFWMAVAALVLTTQAGAKVKFAYRFETGKTYTYAYESKTKVNQEMQGRSMESTIQNSIVAVFEPIGKAENGDMACNARLNKLVFHISNARMDSTFDLSVFTNKRVKLIMTPWGKVKSVAMVDSFPQADPMLKMMGGDADVLFRRMFIDLPRAELDENETWVNTLADTVQVGGMDVVTVPKVEYTYSGRDTVSGFDCAKVTLSGSVEISGKGSSMGADFTAEGEGKVEGALFYADSVGLPISGEIRSEQQISTVITGAANMTMVQNMNTVVKANYVP